MFKSFGKCALALAAALAAGSVARANTFDGGAAPLSLQPPTESKTMVAAESKSEGFEMQPYLLAVVAPPPQTGAFEGAKTISISGTFMHTAMQQPSSAGGGYNNSYSVMGQLGVGYFFTKNIEVKATVGGSVNFTDMSGSQTGTLGFGGQLNYHFTPYSRFDPYVGVLGGGNALFTPSSTTTAPDGNGGVITTTTGSSTTTTGYVGGAVGLNYFATESTSFFIEYNFRYSKLHGQNQYENLVLVGIEFWIH